MYGVEFLRTLENFLRIFVKFMNEEVGEIVRIITAVLPVSSPQLFSIGELSKI